MKKIMAIVLLSISPLIAESLTVLNNQENGKVYLNGVSIGSGTVSNYDVEPGEYVLSIKVDNNVTYKETVVVGVGDNRVVDTNMFVGIEKGQSSVIDYGAKQVEEQRLRKATRGYIGVGGLFGGIGSGISVKVHPIDRLALQATGWATKTGEESHSNIRYRLLYEFEETLFSKDNLSIIYVGIGAGNKSTKVDEGAVIDLDQEKHDSQSSIEAILGIEMSFGSQFYWNFEVSLTQTDQTKETFGYNTSTTDALETLVSFGGHFYFN